MTKLRNIINSPEFKKRSTTVAESGLKTVVKWFEIIIKAVINFLKEMIKMAVGK